MRLGLSFNETMRSFVIQSILSCRYKLN
jgi:hypothetical protein